MNKNLGEFYCLMCRFLFLDIDDIIFGLILYLYVC